MVEVVIAGVTYVSLVSPANAVPPVAAVYQRYWPIVPPAAPIVIAVDAHPAPGVAVGETGKGLIVAVTAVRALSQVPLLIDT